MTKGPVNSEAPALGSAMALPAEDLQFFSRLESLMSPPGTSGIDQKGGHGE